MFLGGGKIPLSTIISSSKVSSGLTPLLFPTAKVVDLHAGFRRMKASVRMH